MAMIAANAPILRMAGVVAILSATAANASVEISTAATQHMHCKKGLCLPTAKRAVLNVDDLTTMLSTESVEIETGSGAVTITVFAPFSWTSSRRLTLEASYNVTFRAPVTVAGNGSVTIITNGGHANGDLIFFPGGKLDFWDTSSALKINSTAFKLVTDVETLAADVEAKPSGAYALANDYDASADGTYEHPPVATIFAGAFEGLGHSIENLSIIGGAATGFFVGAQPSAVMRDINLPNANVIAGGKFVTAGILIAESHGLVDNATASGTVQGFPEMTRRLSSVGGLVGINAGTVANSSASADVTGTRKTAAGGLVGVSASGASIVLSHASGNVAAQEDAFAGGLAGQAYGIADSYATGTVAVGDHSDAGGLAGLGDNISASFATGSVSGLTGSRVGGLVGVGGGAVDSYALGAVQGGDHARTGGLFGVGGAISTSYSIGTVAGGSRALVGGFIGSDKASNDLPDTDWDLDTSGITDPSQGAGNIANDPGITGLTDAQLKSGLPAGFDPKVWGQNPNINNGYPYLLANPPPQ